tara:strand:- start:176 stop:1141 length:966 start_codon:yes stop_codon:yes gene_type:complete
MKPKSYKIEVSAPGKIILWGEYAVLEGAPAVSMAIDRFSRISLSATQAGWGFLSSGFSTPGLHVFEPDFCTLPTSEFVELCLKQLGFTDYHTPFSIHSDTSEFYFDQSKFGLGSSAALITATYLALTKMLDKEALLEEALAIHHHWQKGSGSGIDVATSWHGGVISFQKNPGLSITPHSLPEALQWRAVWTGQSSNTRDHLAHFELIKNSKTRTTLRDLCSATDKLTGDGFSLDAITHYKECLKNFDDAGKLKIFTTPHQRLDRIASELGLVYKPCGAGGGDVGIAFGFESEALSRFCQRVAALKFINLDMEMSLNGVKAT